MRLEWLRARAANLRQAVARDGEGEGEGGADADGEFDEASGGGVPAAIKAIVAAELGLAQTEIEKLEAKLEQEP